ncbi:hypothetical protein ACIBQ5_34220 [Streptomyces massasporeus]|uniref:hypothetical protein n=1 Tax=Streptomyces massasporeus TaxID=67324 RepID=UPI0037B4FA65
MVVAGHHDQYAAAGADRFEVPAHGERRGHAGEFTAQELCGVLAAGCREAHPHEEVAVPAVTELVVVDDVAAVVEQETGDGGDDAGRFGAVEGEDVLGRFHHGTSGRLNSLIPSTSQRAR